MPTLITVSDAAKAVVRRNTEEVQGGGNFGVFEELFADDDPAAALRVQVRKGCAHHLDRADQVGVDLVEDLLIR